MASGAIFGALNPQLVHIDFYLADFDMRLGIGLLLAALAGAILGGFCMWAGLVLPLQRRIARQQRDSRASEQRILALSNDELTL